MRVNRYILLAVAFAGPSIPLRGAESVEPSRELADRFERASIEYNVPRDLLLVLARLGSGFEDRGGAPTIEGGYGLMALRRNDWNGDSLLVAARLLGVEPERLMIEADLNIRGAAAVLDAYAAEAGIDRGAGLEAWRPAIERYAALDAECSALFADEVYMHRSVGFAITNSKGETFIVAGGAGLPPLDTPAVPAESRTLPEPLAGLGAQAAKAPEYPPATWDPVPACNFEAIQNPKAFVVIHMAEGTAAGARAKFKLCSSYASVHYVVSEAGTVWQMVPEGQTSWHAGCYNEPSIGIVHEGFSASADHPEALYQASAALCRYLCEKWSIPVRWSQDEGEGILGHADTVPVCGGQAVDPGVGWDWTHYLELVRGSRRGPQLVSAVSRRTHGRNGVWDIDLKAGWPSECRTGGPRQLIVTFDGPLVGLSGKKGSEVRASSGVVQKVQVDGATLAIDLTGAADRGWLEVRFPGFVGTNGLSIDESLSFGVLAGDANGDNRVTAADYVAIRAMIDCASCPDRARCDLNADGAVNTSDYIVVRGRMGRSVQ